MSKYGIAVAAIILIIGLVSCPDSARKMAIITEVETVIENIDPDWWPSPKTETCCLNFWIHYTGQTIDLETIDYVRIYKSDMETYYEILKQELYFDPVNNIIGGWRRYYDADYEDAVTLTDLKVIIRYNWGFSSVHVFDIPGPGETAATTATHVKTEDYATTPTGFVHAIYRANISSWDKDTSVDIAFTTSDDRVYSGKIDFYDDTGDFVGDSTEYFRNYDTGAVTSIINGNSNFYTNGSTNNVNLQVSEITFENDKIFDDITKFVIVLTDGSQYSTVTQRYAYLSRTRKQDF